MAISEFELKRCESELEKFLEKHRPPAHIRHEVDFAYRIENQSVLLFEVRPSFRDPRSKTEIPIAKTTFVKNQKIWKVYWQRADLNWHAYEPTATVKHLEDFLALVAEDKHCCFFG